MPRMLSHGGCLDRARRPPRLQSSRGLPLDDVVDLEDLRLARVDAHVV